MFRILVLFYLFTLVFCEKIYPDDAFKITFDRANRTYGLAEYVGVKVTHVRKEGDPDLKQVIIATTSRLKTVRRSCEDIENCEIEDSVLVKLSTGHRIFHPFPEPIKIGLNTIEERPGYISEAYKSSFEGINGYERHGMFIEIKTKDNRTQEFPIEYYNAIIGIDLSKDSSYEKPIICQQKSTFQGKEVSMLVEIPKDGWVYPESIPIKVSIENKSSWKVNQIVGDVIMSQKTYTRFGKKDFPIETYKFKESEAIVVNHTVASVKWGNPEKKSFATKDTVTFKIQHREKAFLHTIEMGDIPVLQNRHFVKVSLQLTNPSDSSDLDIPSTLDCELPVTFGIVPTKSTNVKTPTKYVPADKSYQAKIDGDNTVSYPSFEQLRTK